MGASEISDPMRAVIVSQLAMYAANSEVRDYMKEEFDVEVSAMTVARHNPQNKASEGYLRKEFVDLFWTMRENFQRGLEDCGIVWKAYRLRKLDEMMRKAKLAGNFDLAARLLEQAAKEVGGMFDQRRRDGAITLETLQQAIDKLAGVVVREVQDPDVLRRIDEGWGEAGVGTDKAASKMEREWL